MCGFTIPSSAVVSQTFFASVFQNIKVADDIRVNKIHKSAENATSRLNHFFPIMCHKT